MIRTMAKTAGLAAVLAALPMAAHAEDAQLPKTIAWTSYDVGSASYAQAVAIGKAISDAYGVSLRVLPATSDVARLLPLKQGRVGYSLMGSESYNAVEGTEAFGEPELGPQRLTLLAGLQALFLEVADIALLQQ